MPHLIAPDYGQQYLFPPAVEDWVPAESPVRFIREFVDELDLGHLGFVIPAATEGRPPYAPSLLLKIWLYGYYFRIRSTRRLEKACSEVLPLIWLCGRIVPDHNSLWRFWRDNKKALGAVFKQTVQVAVRAGAVGLALQALDGTKIQSVGSSYSGWSKEYMDKLLAALDQNEVKVQEEQAEASAAAVTLPAGLAKRQALREMIKSGLAQIESDQRKHYHSTEPEARRMPVSSDHNRYGYNAQAVVDEKGIVVACDATRHENDQGQLATMTEQAHDNLGVAGHETLTVADRGYGAGADVAQAAAESLNVLVTPSEGGSPSENPYSARHFAYDPVARSVTCPRGHVLDYEGRTEKKGSVAERFRCHCRDCPVRGECTSDKKGRQIEVWPHTPAVQAMRERLKQAAMQVLLARRGGIVERIFGEIKQHDGFRRWTVWGLEAVRAQWAMLCTAVNLRVLYRHWRLGRNTTGPSAGAAVIAPQTDAKTLSLSQIWAKCALLRPIHPQTA